MKKNDLFFCNDTIIRILEIQENNVLYVDCLKKQMPKYRKISSFSNLISCTEAELFEKTNVNPLPIEELSAENRKLAYERYSMIAGVLPYVQNENERKHQHTLGRNKRLALKRGEPQREHGVHAE